ncbi:MAG TPA: DNA repair protein RecN [Candidatus Limnocylindria bacterium]|nr:DNA repair protein RecN [Candidatus Limnocylindria bacterium]
MPLRELTVDNLAVLSNVRLSLASGFTVVTGETGAGKSLVVDALALALGARASAGLVRSGETAARVEAVFDDVPRAADDPMDELVEAGEGMAVVRREVGADGRSLVRINDRAATVGGLALLGQRLAEIHGQHEQQRLLVAERQLELLDRAGGLEGRRDEVGEAYRAWRASVAAAAELLSDPQELARRVELLRYQADEIAAARLRVGEDEELEAAVRAGQHAQEIAAAADAAVNALREDRGAAEVLRAAVRQIHAAAAHDERFAPLGERAEGLAAEVDELARDVAAAADAVDLDPASLAAAEERLNLIYDLRRKYAPTLDDVIAFGDSAADELRRLEQQDAERERLRAEEDTRRQALDAVAAELSDARRRAADTLVAAVNAELPPLGLAAGAFGVELHPIEAGPAGADRVEFTFAPNPGEPPRALARIASGGEASRLSLALKVVLAGADETPLLVFDEVDAGIGGRNAAALGERLKRLSAHHQVLCVTHLPQVAAYADAHIHVGKRVEAGRTYTDLRELSADERRSELAAMLGGEGAGDEAHAAADALLRSAR